jgi:predicted nucleic acid-binding protein
MSLLPPLPPGPSNVEAIPFVVIDTNALLDWLVFEDASAVALGPALTTGAMQWIGTRAMCEEFEHVLARPVFERWSVRRISALATVAEHCRLLADPPVAASGRLHCSDPDDQKFIDLAMTQPARWLITRDKALLRLARKARQRGVDVLTPIAWAKQVGLSTVLPAQ